MATARSNAKAKTKFLKATGKLIRTISRAFDQGPELPHTSVNDRDRYAAALFAMAQYFSALAGRPLGDRFFELGSAIADLNNGTVHPLLRPVRSDNRRADTSQLWRARARVAMGLEALLRSGLNQTDAAAKLASRHSDIANLAGRKAKYSTLQTIVFGWRRELKAGRVKNFEASALFAEGLERINRLASAQAHRKFADRQFADAVDFSRVLSRSS